MFFNLARNQTYIKDNINLFVALGPVATLTTSGIIFENLKNILHLYPTMVDMGIWYIPGNEEPAFTSWFCSMFSEVCMFSLYYITSGTTEPIDLDSFKVAMGHWPRATSLKSFTHFGQILKNERFAEFDYGTDENLEKYG